MLRVLLRMCSTIFDHYKVTWFIGLIIRDRFCFTEFDVVENYANLIGGYRERPANLAWSPSYYSFCILFVHFLWLFVAYSYSTSDSLCSHFMLALKLWTAAFWQKKSILQKLIISMFLPPKTHTQHHITSLHLKAKISSESSFISF